MSHLPQAIDANGDGTADVKEFADFLDPSNEYVSCMTMDVRICEECVETMLVVWLYGSHLCVYWWQVGVSHMYMYVGYVVCNGLVRW